MITSCPHPVPSLCYASDARERARKAATRRWMRAREARKLISRFESASTFQAWNQARALARMVGAPDPGCWSEAPGVIALLRWAEAQGAWRTRC